MGITRPSASASPDETSSRKSAPSAAVELAGFGKLAKCPSEALEHLAGVPRVEELDRGGVDALRQRDIDRLQKARHGHPEVVAHHDQGRNSPAVTLLERPHQLGVGLVGVGLEPLLELVEDEEKFSSCPVL